MVVGMFTTFYLCSLYLERVRGFDPVATGLAFLPQTVVVAVFALPHAGTAAGAAQAGGFRLAFWLLAAAVAIGLAIAVRFLAWAPRTGANR